MIQLNSANLIFAKATDNSAFDLKSKSTLTDTSGDFKDVFSRTMSKTNNRDNSGLRNDNNKEFSAASGSQSKYKTFRSLKVEQTAKSDQIQVELSEGEISGINTDSPVKNTADNSESYDDQINVLAQLLGITPAELVKLAEELGFSAEDFSNTGKLDQMMDKLGDMLYLNSSQKELLANLAKEVTKQLAEVRINSFEKQLTAQSAQMGEVQEKTDTQITDLSGIANNIKTRLDELLQKAQYETEAIGLEVSKVIEAMKSQAQNRSIISFSENMAEVASAAAASEADQNPVNVSTTEADANKAADKTKEEKGNINVNDSAAKSDSNTTEVKTVSVQVNTDTEHNLQDQTLSAFTDLKTGELNSQTQVVKAEFKMPQTVKPSELINQVVERTKVIIGNDKTEMVIHLKPDHLGKLELKVVTEQGIVAAKFIAENQQVKEIIESNMQLLKDSLQKQGIYIDSVSVQVGQDKKNEYQNNYFANSNNGSSGRAKQSPVESSVTGISGTNMETLPERLAQYSDETSTINLTA